MTTMTNEQLLEKVTAALTTATTGFQSQAENALKEAKNAGSLSQSTKDAVDKALTEIGTLTTAQNALTEQLSQVEQNIVRSQNGGGEKKVKSFGEQVLAYDGLADFAARVKSNERCRVSVPVRAALLTGGLGAGVIEPDRQSGTLATPKQRLFLRDLVSSGRTTSNAISWIQQTGFVNNAGVVVESTRKPTSTINYALKMTPVATIAHIFKAAKQVMDDLPQLASDIDVEMRYGLKYAEEQQLLFGDGTGANLHGIVPQATAFAPGFTVAEQTPIDDIRLAMLQAQLARLPASGTVLHFIDWAKIELTKDSLGRYILANPLGLLGPVLWGVPVVATEIAAFVGKFLTGAFQGGAQIYDREDANVVIATENEDDFVNNLIAVRCEERLGFAVKRPEAFIYGALTQSAAAGA
ncbi:MULTISPECIES: phage major capsid protein [Luteibacter]|uniref:phage major capsid protein n=1 Tax=Luteibacter TaxID=242605 RepID=UPI000AC441BC|nr:MULTISPECIES: phage major capsid protein [unclassified Luteibacter]